MKIKYVCCGCDEWEFKFSKPDAEIRKERGTYCVDCSSPLKIRVITLPDKVVSPEKKAQDERDFAWVCAFVGMKG